MVDPATVLPNSTLLPPLPPSIQPPAPTSMSEPAPPNRVAATPVPVGNVPVGSVPVGNVPVGNRITCESPPLMKALPDFSSAQSSTPPVAATESPAALTVVATLLVPRNDSASPSTTVPGTVAEATLTVVWPSPLLVRISA